MTTRHCPKCKQTKAQSDFYRNKNKADGYASWCKLCSTVASVTWRAKKDNKQKHKQQAVDRRRNRKLELIEMFGGKCADCGLSFQPCCYDFHHLDPSKKDASVSALGTMKMERILAEVIGKCIMICSNCHRIRHHGQS